MDKFEKILDIIDHQEKYSDEEIREILQDEECRKLYQTMTEVDAALVKQGLEKEDSSLDMDEEWRKFEGEHLAQSHTGKSWRKMAAVVGFVLVSGIAFAAIHTFVKRSREPMLIAQGNHVENFVSDSIKQGLAKDSVATINTDKPAVHKTFENVSFDKMITEIAAYYDLQVRFDNAEAKNFRLYYEWDSYSGIESIVKELNQFENVNIGLDGKTIVIK